MILPTSNYDTVVMTPNLKKKNENLFLSSKLVVSHVIITIPGNDTSTIVSVSQAA